MVAFAFVAGNCKMTLISILILLYRILQTQLLFLNVQGHLEAHLLSLCVVLNEGQNCLKEVYK